MDKFKQQVIFELEKNNAFKSANDFRKKIEEKYGVKAIILNDNDKFTDNERKLIKDITNIYIAITKYQCENFGGTLTGSYYTKEKHNVESERRKKLYRSKRRLKQEV